MFTAVAESLGIRTILHVDCPSTKLAFQGFGLTLE